MVQELKGTNLEDRVQHLASLEAQLPPDIIEDYREKLLITWIYHDSALEGVVYTMDELKAAILEQVVSDSSLIPVYDEINHHKAAIALIREMTDKKRFAITLEVIKQIYVTLAPEENDGKGGPTYRKDMPLHRLYFHEIATPDKISYRMRQLVQWLNAQETKRSVHATRLAAKVHTQLLQIYPFPKNSGKVARLLMNLILLRNGYPPAILHSTERQRYYDALKTSDDTVAVLIQEALVSSVESAIRFFEDAVAAQNGTVIRSA